MQCPLCKKHTMNAVVLEPDLPGLACDECGGVWVSRANYDAWRARQPAAIPENPAPVAVEVTDTHKAKICPECRHLLLPYRVGHGLPFSIDYCGACGGVWFDKNEWTAIKAKNLHGDLHDIVSDHWQVAVRQADMQEKIEQTYQRLLGPAYEKAADVRAWLQKQPLKSLLLAYLSGTKPEKV